MIPWELPEGTTREQWEQYERDLKAHEEHIKQYRFFLDRIVNHLKWKDSSKLWTHEAISNLIMAEIDMSSSCDAPNKPGYYRANND